MGKIQQADALLSAGGGPSRGLTGVYVPGRTQSDAGQKSASRRSPLISSKPVLWPVTGSCAIYPNLDKVYAPDVAVVVVSEGSAIP